jgi:hypothetical protein
MIRQPTCQYPVGDSFCGKRAIHAHQEGANVISVCDEHRDKLLVVTEEKRKKAEEIRTQLEMEATEKANEKWMKERFGEWIDWQRRSKPAGGKAMLPLKVLEALKKRNRKEWPSEVQMMTDSVISDVCGHVREALELKKTPEDVVILIKRIEEILPLSEISDCKHSTNAIVSRPGYIGDVTPLIRDEDGVPYFCTSCEREALRGGG